MLVSVEFDVSGFAATGTATVAFTDASATGAATVAFTVASTVTGATAYDAVTF